MVKDSASFRIIFPVDTAKIQPEKSNNRIQLDSINYIWKQISTSDLHYNVSIHVRGNASVEGPEDRSMSLARSRGFATLYYLYKRYSIPDSLIHLYDSRHMLIGANECIDTLPPAIKAQVDFDNVRLLMNTTQPQHLRRKLLSCDTTGFTWQWFNQNVLDPTRYCDVFICYDHEKAETKDTTVAAPVIDTIVQTTAVDTIVPQKKAIFRIKTNLLYDIATVPSLGFEVGFAKRFGFSLLGTFSPWDIKKPNFKVRTLLFQPEFRAYLKEGWEGHYFGIDGHYGWYNVAMPKSATRYQDRDGEHPLWGAGLVYGYVLPLNKHIGFDFSVGAGYANLDYDCFYNIENGKKYTSSRKHYWGLTNLGVSFFYKF